jgi:hypothetical protein
MRKYTALCITLFALMGITQAQKSVIWGIDAQIRNFGFDFGVSKFSQLKGSNSGETFGFKIGNLTDPKEISIVSQILPGAQPFKLDKINYSWVFKPFYGKSISLTQRKSRLDIGCKVFGNLSLPIAYSWPVFILYYNATPPFDGYNDVQYNPEIHNPKLIGGTSAFTKGFNSGKFQSGVGVSGGITFEWGSYRSISNSLSLGFSTDVFVQRIPLLYTQETNRQIFPALFVNFAFGFGDIN